jgi:hypothetical protein
MQISSSRSSCLPAIDRRNKMMEWLVNVKILLEAPNYLCDHDVVCTNKEGFNQIQRITKDDTVLNVRVLTTDHAESPDQNRQTTIDHTTFGSDHIINQQNLTANAKGFLFEDNKQLVMNKLIPCLSLRRKHVTSSYHHV